MRCFNWILILLIFSLGFLGFTTRVDARSHGKTAVNRASTQVRGSLPEGPPPIQEQKIALTPFFRLQHYGSKVWVERIIVAFSMTLPKNYLKHDLENPTFRKMLYDLLQSGEPETTIQTQCVAELRRQVGLEVEPNVQISRSVLIVR